VEIDLGKGLIAVIDDADAEMVAGYDWYAFKSRDKFYAVAGAGRNRIFLHKHIMGAGPGEQIDHTDNQSLNCRRLNLRPATHQQNAWNMKPLKREGRATPYKGVSLDRTHGRYKAQIMHDGRRISLGYFNTAEDAARAYNEAAERLRGDFAYLNSVALPQHATLHANLEILGILGILERRKSLFPQYFGYSCHPHTVEAAGSNPAPPNDLHKIAYPPSAFTLPRSTRRSG
jgi:hypothetical protein